VTTSVLIDTPVEGLTPPPTASVLIATLREYGVTEQMLTPDMRQTIEEIADDLANDP
jgi:hypothetical protein